MLPLLSTATPCGYSRRALVGIPPSPLSPDEPVPTTVDIESPAQGAVGVAVPERDCVAEFERVGVGVPVCDAVDDLLAVPLEVGMPVCDTVEDLLPVALELGVPVCDDVVLKVDVPVCDDVDDPLGVLVDVAVVVEVTVRVPLEDVVRVLLAVMEAVRVDPGPHTWTLSTSSALGTVPSPRFRTRNCSACCPLKVSV